MYMYIDIDIGTEIVIDNGTESGTESYTRDGNGVASPKYVQKLIQK